MAGVDNSHAIFGPQGLHEGQNQSHAQKPSQVPLDCLEGEAHVHTQRHTHTSHVLRKASIQITKRGGWHTHMRHLSPHYRHLSRRQLKALQHKRLVILVAKDQRLRDHAQKGQLSAQDPWWAGRKYYSFLTKALPRSPLHVLESVFHITPNSNSSSLDQRDLYSRRSKDAMGWKWLSSKEGLLLLQRTQVLLTPSTHTMTHNCL